LDKGHILSALRGGGSPLTNPPTNKRNPNQKKTKTSESEKRTVDMGTKPDQRNSNTTSTPQTNKISDSEQGKIKAKTSYYTL